MLPFGVNMSRAVWGLKEVHGWLQKRTKCLFVFLPCSAHDAFSRCCSEIEPPFGFRQNQPLPSPCRYPAPDELLRRFGRRYRHSAAVAGAKASDDINDRTKGETHSKQLTALQHW